MTLRKATHTSLIIRDLPDITGLEVDLLFHRKAYEGIEEDLSKHVAEKLFGVWIAQWDDIYSDHPELFNSWELADDEAMVLLMTLGVDFSDDRGNPLRCTRWLAASAEVAARGIAGRLPDNLDQFASSLERDRDAFIASKRRGL